jgi:hypothetical protein
MPSYRNAMRLVLAALLSLLAAAFALGARAQTTSISVADLGKVAAAASGVTTFRFAAASGNVTVASGSGSRISTGSVRFTVVISCDNNDPCKNGNTILTYGAIGSPTGRAGTLTNFTFTNGTATLASGPTGTPPGTIIIGPIGAGNSVTIYLGADFPIYGDDQSGKPTGLATSGMYVRTTDKNGNHVQDTGGTATAMVSRNMTIAQNTALNFGTIYRPSSGSSNVSLPASTGVRSVSGNGGAYISPTPSRGQFTIAGEGGQIVSVNVPSSFTLRNGATNLSVSLSNTGSGTQVLSGGAGGAGSFSFFVGGAFSINSTTPVGAYSGTYTVTVSYN